MFARALSHVSLCAAAILACLGAPHARAEPELALKWPDVEGCPGAAHIVARIEEQIARELAHAPEALRASATITKHGDGFRLTLRTERGSEHGERTFEAKSCEEVSDAAALLIALSMGAAAEPPDWSLAESAPAAPHERTERRYLLRAAAVGERGYLPRVGGGAELSAAIAWGRSRTELSALLLPPVFSERQGDGARVEVWLWAARIGYCHDLVGQRVWLLACVGAELGRATGRGGEQLLGASEEHFVWAAGTFSVRIVGELTQHLALYLEPAVALPVLRRRFVSTGRDGARQATLHEPSLASARIALGLQIAF